MNELVAPQTAAKPAQHPMEASDFRFRKTLAALQAVQSVNPDRYAKARQQSRILDVPAPVLYRAESEKESESEAADSPALALLKLAQQGNRYAQAELERNVRTYQALSSGDTAAVAQDDMSAMLRIEQARQQTAFDKLSLGEKLAGAWNGGWWQLRQASDVQLLKNQAQHGGLLDQYLAMDKEFAEAKASGKRWDNPNKYLYGFEYYRANEEQRAAMREQAKQGDEKAWNDTTVRLAQRQKDLNALPLDPAELRVHRLQQAGFGSFEANWQTVKEYPAFAGRIGAGAAASSLPILAAAAAGGAVGGTPLALAAMGTTEYGTEYNARFLEVLQKNGVNLADQASLLKAFSDEALMQQATEEAHLKALGTTAVDLALGGIASRVLAPLKIRGRVLTQGQREAFNLAWQIPIQGLGEGASEAFGQYLATGEVDGGEVLREIIGGGLFSAVDVGVFSQRRLAGYLKDARQAKQGASALDAMAAAAAESKTRLRDGQAFREIVKTQLEGSPLERLFLPPSALTELAQSGELAPLLSRVDGLSERYQEAAASGEELPLSTADYLLAFGEQHEQLKDKVRFANQSLEESTEFAEDYAQRLHDLKETLNQSAETSREQHYQQALGELLSAGFNRTEASHYASLQLAAWERLEERTGIALQDLKQRFDLSIKNQGQPKAAKVTDLSLMLGRLRAGDIPTQQAVFGDSLRQALIKAGGLKDDGGELSARDVDKGKRGKNRLTRPNGMTLDHAAEWAQQEGYLPPNEPYTPDLLLAALDRESQGQPVYSASRLNSELQKVFDDLNTLQSAITQSGLDLATMTDEEVINALNGTAEPSADSTESKQVTLQQEAIAAVIKAAKQSGHAPQKTVLGEVTDWLATEAAKYGLNLQGFVHTLDGSAVRHMLNRHSNPKIEKTRGQLALTDVDIQNLPQVVQQADAVILGTQTKGRKEQIAFIKRMPDGTVLYLEEVRTGKRELAAVSMRKYPATRDFSAIVDSTLPSNARSDSGDGVIVVTPPDASKSELQQSGERSKSPRGSIRFEADIEAGQPRRFEIQLSATRDLSTLLHELGHFWLEVASDVVATGEANAELTQDLSTLRAWLNAKEGAAFTVEQHEQFARGFEAYLAEGRAPSAELVPAFERFKRWIIGVYKDLTRLNVSLNDEIRAVFGRLLASEQQVLEAQNQSAALALFESAEKAGMSETEFAAYRDSIERAHSEASEQVLREITNEQSAARKKWWQGEAEKVRQEVAEEVDALPVYAALKALRSGELKLNTGELVKTYGASPIKKLAFLHQKDGVSLSAAASLLGFDSSDALVKALLSAQPRREAIEQETAQRMLERFGAQINSEAAEKALIAVHGAARENVLQLELAALGKQTRRKDSAADVLKQAARQMMQRRQVGSIAPDALRRAEAKAGREAFNALLKGDLETAFAAKQRQLLNFYLWREAVAARAAIDSAVKRLQAFRKNTRRSQLGKSSAETLALIDTLLYQFGLSSREPEQSASLMDWYQRQLEAGTEPYLPSFLLQSRERQSVRDLAFSQLVELDEFAQHLWHLAKQNNALIAGGQRLDFYEARQQLIEGGYQNRKAGKKPPIDPSQVTLWEKLKDTAGGFVATLLKMEQIIAWLDGDKVDGAWSQRFWQPFVEAQNEQSRLQKTLTEQLASRLERYQKEAGRGRLRQSVFVDSLGQSLSVNALLAVALNSGNASNKAKLLRGYGWDEGQLAGALSHLNQADWQLVQDLWDLVGSLWPAIEALQRELTGLAPDAVEAAPIETPFGTFKGGYWPLVYDKSSAAYARVQESSPTELLEAGYIRATTPKGHTKSRVEGFAAPILLSLDVVVPHLAQVVHDLTHRKAVRDGAKIASDPQIKQMLIDTLGSATADQFMLWVKGIANSQTLSNTQGIHAWARLSERLRSNLAIGYMGFSATTSIAQILGYGQSLEYFAKQGGRRYLAKGMAQFLSHPIESAAMIKALSGEMRHRSDNLDRDMKATLNRISGKTGVLPVIQRLAFKPIAFIQSLVDYPTWLGAFAHAQAQGHSQDLAVQAADRAVRLTQMAAGAKDLAAVQRDHGLMRWLTIVYSYQSLLFNRLADISQSDTSGTKNKLLFLERYMWLAAVPAILAPLLQGRGAADDDDWDEWAALKIATYPLQSIPVLRDAEGLLEGWAMKGTTPLSDVGNALARFIGTEDEHKRLNAAIEATGYGLGLPVAQPKRTVGYLWERLEGEHQDDDFKDFIRGVLFGARKKD